MTSEICMMNRLAVVLAADSATTVTSWNNGKREERYFKGANKIFQLSDTQPVGVMIYDSADILQVPWEVAIKCFRSHLGPKSFNTIDDYAMELFAFLDDNTLLFPREASDEAVVSAALTVAIGHILDIEDKIKSEDAEQLLAELAHSIEAKMADKPPPLGLTESIVNDVTRDVLASCVESISGFLIELGVSNVGDLSRLAMAAINMAIRQPRSSFSATGIVFSGFADKQIFPKMSEYRSFGIIGGKHVYEQVRSEEISHALPASITSFAQTSMIDTFSLGLSEETYLTVMLALKGVLNGLTDEIVSALGANQAQLTTRADLVQAASNKISESVLEKAKENHSLPLRRVIGFLPVDEMAELSETLIKLQSLKEKVTKPSETVGGPVDVAVITKHEGLVWIKRKHFFDPKLNSRYMVRQTAHHGRA